MKTVFWLKVLSASVVLISFNVWLIRWIRRRDQLMDVIRKQDEETPEPNLKLILLWSDFNPRIKKWHHMSKFGRDPFVRDNCTFQNCNLTLDRSEIDRADVVMFLDDQIGPGWPERRYPHQLYVHVLNERPGPWHSWIKDFDGKINLSMTYRRDADIYYNRRGCRKRLRPRPGPYLVQYPLVNKTRDAAWVVSHCGAESRRDEYVAELSKYITVDIYGKCGNLSCPRTDECKLMLERGYKFYLAFENAMCEGYATEKVFAYMLYELVPVVLGKFDYKRETPPHSVIDIRDYGSPKELATYLRYLANNETAYYEYFQWKQTYEVPFTNQSEYCALCNGINNPKFANGNLAGGYYDWWFRGCDNEYINRMRARGGW